MKVDVDVLDVGPGDSDDGAEHLGITRRRPWSGGVRGAVVASAAVLAALGLVSMHRTSAVRPGPVEPRRSVASATAAETVIAVSPQVGAALLRSPACQASRFCVLVPTEPRQALAYTAPFDGAGGIGGATEATVTTTGDRVIGRGAELSLPGGTIVRLTVVVAVGAPAAQLARPGGPDGDTTVLAARRGGWDLAAALIVPTGTPPPISAARTWIESSPLPS